MPFEHSVFGPQVDIYQTDPVFYEGNLYISANVDDYSGSESGIMVLRYSSDGVLDTSFGTSNGYTKISTAQSTGPGTLQLDSSGNLFVNGEEYDGVRYQAAVWKFTNAGTLDTSFGTNGVWSDPDTTRNFFSQLDGSLIFLDDGEILISGEGRLSDSGDWYPMIFRLSSNGTLDNGFGDNGMVINTDAAGAFTAMSRNSVGDISIGGYSGGDMSVWKYE